jgi:hypothetical protein
MRPHSNRSLLVAIAVVILGPILPFGCFVVGDGHRDGWGHDHDHDEHEEHGR